MQPTLYNHPVLRIEETTEQAEVLKIQHQSNLS